MELCGRRRRRSDRFWLGCGCGRGSGGLTSNCFGCRFLFAGSSRSGTSVTLVGLSIFIAALRSSPVTFFGCPLSNLPPLSVSETEVLTVKEVEQILYRILVSCCPCLGLFTYCILVQVCDRQSRRLELLEELLRRLRAGCRARKRGVEGPHGVHGRAQLQGPVGQWV